MTADEELEELEGIERKGWDALSAGASEAREFYDGVLTDSPTMLLPGGLILRDRGVMLQTMGDSPWTSFEISDLVVSEPAPESGLVTYSVVAHRGDDEYSALLSSLYVRKDGGWRLAFHQQTPR